MRDEDVRTSCSAALEVLAAEFGEDIPYQNGLDRGFAFRGQRVPFFNRQKGIHRAAVQRGPAALSLLTSWKSPYGDELTPDGVVYAYREGPVDQPDNRALRAAFELQVPLVYFLGTRPWWYRSFYPAFVVADDPGARAVLVSFGRMIGPVDEREPMLVEDPIERRYVVREVKTRMHQARFSGAVCSRPTAINAQCAA